MDIIIEERRNCEIHWFQPLVDGTAVADGSWYDTNGYEAVSYHVSGIIGDTLKIFGANIFVQPVAADDHIQLGSDITADGIYVVVTPCRWQKIEITGNGTGTVNVYVTAIGKKTR